MADRRYVRPRLPLELADRIDAVRGDAPLERWVRRALEAALSGSSVGQSTGTYVGVAGSSPASAAPPRASVLSTSERELEGLRNVAESLAGPSERPTAVQLAGRTGLPRSTCQRALDDGSWEKL